MLRGAIYGTTAAAIWGGMYVVSDVVLRTVPPFTLLTIRLLIGLAVLALILGQMPHVTIPAGRERWRLMVVGALGFGVSVGAQFVGTDLSNAVNGALITSASPAFILLFAVLILREPLSAQRLTAVALATIGVLVIIDPARADFGSDALRGNVALGVAAITWGLFSVLLRKVSANRDALVVTSLGFAGGLALTAPAAAIELTQRPIGQIDSATILGILYLGIISTAAAMWLWNRAFALVEASRASLFFFAQPLTGALLATLIGQTLTPALVVGGLLIALGVLLSFYPIERLAALRAQHKGI